ncbi:hypothetical protein FIBSPDRAFT_779858 [Athelia psychrophila]|uniref:BTB domain-containing protein n=1 Tax=Athelia psychrophila TaxID=1759441 RepID=A0A166RN87_9AGAM|nr:hypothetical protein FIBSPDRAFT_779858 [Fibularhizoctonia sp. CBS 109695]
MAHQTREPREAALTKVVHHREYYLRGGDITFLVENHLYRVHSYFFDRESTYFHQKLSQVSAPGEEHIGASDRNAFTLEHVRSIDFERLLWVFYNPKYSLYDKTVEEWTSVLDLANEWSFVEVKNLAVRELEKLEIDPIEKVYIYHRFNISRGYLVVSYASIVVRQGPLTLLEGRKLGLDTSLKIAEARERLRSQITDRSGVRSPMPDDFDPKDVDTLVRELFEVPTRPHNPSAPASAGGTNGRALSRAPSRTSSRASSSSHPSSPPMNTVSPPPGRAQQNEYGHPQSNGGLMRGISSMFGDASISADDKGEDVYTTNGNSESDPFTSRRNVRATRPGRP